MDFLIARARNRMSGRRRIPQRPAASRVIFDDETPETSGSEFCEILAGRLLVAYDAAKHRERRTVLLSVDDRRFRRMRAETMPLGGRLLQNGDFGQGLTGWSVGGRGPGIRVGIDLSPEWTLEDGHTAFLKADATEATPSLVYVGPTADNAIPVVAGREYVASALIGAHRCEVVVRVEMLDAAGEVVSTLEDRIPTDTRGGRDRADYHYTRVVTRAPLGAVGLRLTIGKGATLAGQSDSFAFVAETHVGWEGELLPAWVMTPERQEQVLQWREPTLLRARLPSVVLDGRLHGLDVRDTESGEPLSRSPREIQQVELFDGAIESIDGQVVSGWARNLTDDRFITAVALELDGIELAQAEGQPERAEKRQTYRLVLPRHALDGRAHVVTVRAIPSGSIVSEVATVLSGPGSGTRAVHFDDVSQRDDKSLPELKQALRESEQARFSLAHQLEQHIAAATASAGAPAARRSGADRHVDAIEPDVARPRAAIVAWDVGHNPVGRAFVLHELIKDRYDIDVIGPNWERYGEGIWPYAQAPDADMTIWRCRDLGDFVPQAMLHATWTDYDIVVVSKPRLPSLFIGLLIKEHSGCPLVLDIDDEELSFVGDGGPIDFAELVAAGPDALVEPYEALATRYANSLVRHADAITVSNVALARRYGGHIVRHSRDETRYVIDEATRASAREELGIAEDEFALMWAGTPRGHKGMLDVARVLQEMGDPSISFHVIGDFPDRRLSDELQGVEGARIRLHGRREFAEIPRLLSAADAVPLLQDPDHPIAHFQFPAKLTDAIALGIPVLATRVEPIEDVLPSDAVTEVTAETLADAIVAARAGASPERSRRIQAVFLGEFSDSVNRARAHLALDTAATAVKPLPPELPELKELLVREAGRILRDRQKAIVGNGARAGGALGAHEQLPDVAVFWKQNDTGLYGRRTEMIVKYLLETGRVGKVMVFDAPLSLSDIATFRDKARDRSRGEFGLLLRNSLLRWQGLLDQGAHLQRVYVHGATPDDQLLGVPLPSRDGYAEWVVGQLDAAGFVPANTVAWVCPVAWQFPEVHAVYPFERVVADIIDDQRAWPINPDYRERLEASYSETLALADVVTTNCQPVADAFEDEAGPIHIIPNGTESYVGREDPPPRQLKDLPRPIIGYVGNMRDRIDWSLLGDVVGRRPDWTFVLAGPTDGRPEADDLRARPNVVMPGAVEYAELASYLLAFDVAIVPHDRSPLTESMNPLKIYNYLAAGLPVVATGIPNIDEVADFIDFAEDADTFVAAIQRALDAPGASRPGLAEVLAEVEWTARVEEIGALIGSPPVPTTVSDETSSTSLDEVTSP